MHRDGMPAEVRELRANPVRREIKRLQIEDEELAEEEKRVREQPPELPEAERMRGVNEAAYRSRALGSVVERRSQSGKALKDKRPPQSGLTRWSSY